MLAKEADTRDIISVRKTVISTDVQTVIGSNYLFAVTDGQNLDAVYCGNMSRFINAAIGRSANVNPKGCSRCERKLMSGLDVAGDRRLAIYASECKPRAQAHVRSHNSEGH
jgi:hypothetical protein